MAVAVTPEGAIRRAMLAMVLLLAGVLATSDASASSRLCRDLEGQLARVGGGGASPARARQYERAIADQRRQIDRAESQARRAGCAGGFGRSSPSACQSLRATLDRMYANLSTLERSHRQLSGGRRDDATARARILASLDANGCRTTTATRRPDGSVGSAGPTFLDRLFGGGLQDRQPEEVMREPVETDRQRQRSVIVNGSRIEIRPRVSGTFRTLCVRSCDGYFFPVAYSTSAAELDRDAAACRAQCPGTEVELYIHRTPGEETSEMVSLAGVPYTQLPTAFLYRKAGFVRPQTCGCGVPKNFSILAGDHAQPVEADPVGVEAPASEMVAVPLPRPRPDPATDLETMVNRDGGLDQAAIRNIVNALKADPVPTASTSLPGAEGERRIRVVGPAFLPDPEGAIDLQAPVPTLVQ
ncbi:DUF2865 domain-containing protein [Aquibium carbonis]|uniref:DUF2865 domain-containing protein n=1 Tax=Aquibium carbonis TaxID=2495581 RepID=A0A3S0A8B8_9HYPH|nr:DUF2865 domain-containing protein [Aquibium carbonis]RST86975.1 DUF2865 domain-containing protein [Aquibium carbonis]